MFAFIRYPALIGLFVVVLFLYMSAHAVQTTWTYYNMEKFKWDTRQVGYSLAVVGILIALVQGLLIRKIIPWLGQKWSLYLGLLLYITGYVLFALATKGWMMYAFLVPYCMGGIAGPALQSLLTAHVKSSEQGELQGLLTSLMSLTSDLRAHHDDLAFLPIYARPGGALYLPGAPFLAGAVFLGCSLVTAYLTLRNEGRDGKAPA